MGPMKRRTFIQALGLALAGWIGPPQARGAEEKVGADASDAGVDRLEKPLSAWREILEPRRFAVLFEEDTERSYSSPLNNEKRSGTYICAACFLPLFESKTKYDSHTGWPSFWAPIEGRVASKTDYRLLFPRTEYHCARCAGHQGHVFSDGPPPTGKRWCNNGLALEFVPSDKPLPELRS